MRSDIQVFGSTFDCGTYGAGTYQNASCGSASSTSGSGSILSNTGFDILLIVSIAFALSLVALLVRIWKRPGKQSPADHVEQG